MKHITKTSIVYIRTITFIILALVVTYFATYADYNSFIEGIEYTGVRPQAAVVSLIRSTNRSIFLAINMIHSIIQFYPAINGSLYPLIIFHDENFTSVMRQQILSCVLKTKKNIRISFALVNFQTSVQPSNGSRIDKPLGYRLMCRFWTYDVFYHPAIIQGQYEYLMRMDDDSYFSDVFNKDIFLYVHNRKLDYIYQATYSEPITPMESILQRLLKKKPASIDCIYNNFFVIRLKWFYESRNVQSFIHELLKDDLMLREYIGDGCVHAAMLRIDKQAKVEHISHIPYGHNFHLKPKGHWQTAFRAVNDFYDEMNKSCQQLTVLSGIRGTLTRINIS